MEDEDQEVDLPDLIDEREKKSDTSPDHVHRYQEGAAGQPIGEGADDGCNTDIGYHLDRQRRSQHGACLLSGDIVSQQTQGDGRQPGPNQRNHLRQEQVTVGSIGEHCEHGSAFSS